DEGLERPVERGVRVAGGWRASGDGRLDGRDDEDESESGDRPAQPGHAGYPLTAPPRREGRYDAVLGDADLVLPRAVRWGRRCTRWSSPASRPAPMGIGHLARQAHREVEQPWLSIPGPAARTR